MMNNNRSLRDNLQILRKRMKVVLIVFVGIFGVTLLGTFLTTPIYEGTAQIIIERVEGDTLTGKNRYEPPDPEFINTQFQLIRSQAVGKRVVDLLGLDVKPEEPPVANADSWLGSLKSSVDEWVTSLKEMVASKSEEKPPPDREDWTEKDLIADSLTRNVSVQSVRGSHITAVSFRSPDPELAAQVANTFIQAYLEETLSMKMEATRRNLEWMTEKAEVERLKLQATEKKLQDYMKEHDLVTLEDRVAIIPEKLAQLGRDLVSAESKTKETKLLYDKVIEASGNIDAAESVLSISEGTTLEVLRAQILQAEQNIMELSNKYGAKHPMMVKARGDLAVLKDKRRQEINRITQKVKNQYELAKLNENSLRAQLNETKAEAMVLNEKYSLYSILKREIETNRQLYNTLLAKIKDQSITGGTRPVNIWIVEEAKIPPSPVKPMKAANLALGLFFGLFCGVGFAFVVDHFDNRIKSSEGVEDALGLPVIGSVNYSRQKDMVLDIGQSTSSRTEFAESYNSLLTTLQLSSPGIPPRKILITSSMAGEGKTTTAANLAVTMVKNGSRVLLIDADLRKPRLHKIFKVGNKVGLSSYLAGTTGKPVINKSINENLVVLAAGPTPPNPYELLNSSRMRHLVESVANEFDAVICDSPPALSVADSRVLSSFFDGVILVARARMTPFPLIQKSIGMLRAVNCRILGLLVNAVRSEDQDYYQYYSTYLTETDKPEQPVQRALSSAAMKK